MGIGSAKKGGQSLSLMTGLGLIRWAAAGSVPVGTNA